MGIKTTVPIINFKGDDVGTIFLEIQPTIDKFDQDVYFPMEINLNDYLGDRLCLDVKIHHVDKLPKLLSRSVFVCSSFFLQQAHLITSRCKETTVNPYFEASFSLSQIITDDFLAYLANSALELQVWGQEPG